MVSLLINKEAFSEIITQAGIQLCALPKLYCYFGNKSLILKQKRLKIQ